MKRNQLFAALASAFSFNVGSSFDPNSFAAGSFEGAGDTRRFQLPPGEYNAFIVGPWQEDKKTRIAVSDKGSVQLVVVWQPDAPELCSKFNLDKLPPISQRVFLDVNESGNGLDMGPFKNAELNKLREAFGLNGDGVKWSFQDFIGKSAKIKVEQKPNKDDPANPYTNVTAVIRS